MDESMSLCRKATYIRVFILQSPPIEQPEASINLRALRLNEIETIYKLRSIWYMYSNTQKYLKSLECPVATPSCI